MKFLTIFLLLLASASPSFGRSATMPVREIDFGAIKIGEQVKRLPLKILKRKNCREIRNPLSCQLLLSDGIWYSFKDSRLIDKFTLASSRSLPYWINSNDKIEKVRKNLETFTGVNFGIWKDDYSVYFLESSEMIKSVHGKYFNIVVTFNKGKMKDVSITTLPHVDV